VLIGGRQVSPGQQVLPAVQNVVVNFSERVSTLGGAAGADSVTNLANWRLTKDGVDISSSIRPINFSYNAATRKYEAVLDLSPLLVSGNYVLTALDAIRDVAANALDGDLNGTAGGVVNDPPTTIGIPSVAVAEDQEDTLVNLFDAFSDATDPDSALTYEVTGNTNPALFDSTRVDRKAGVLVLEYAPNANGEARLTVRATDTIGQFVETTFTVTVVAVNDAPVNTVPGVQVARPGQAITFAKDLDNLISVSDVDDPAAQVVVTIEYSPNLTVEPSGVAGVDIKRERGLLRLSGRIPDVNAALDGMRVAQVFRQEQQASLQITTDDLGSRGAGGPMSDTDVIPVVFGNNVAVLTVGDVNLAEGDAGTTEATFTVRLSGNALFPVSVRYATADGSATAAGGDYRPAQGELVFGVLETEKTVTVVVNGNIDVEGDEQFFLNLFDAGFALIGDGQGVGTITDDDAPRPPPVVTQVYVSGSGWSAAYKSFLQAQGLGDATFGYAVPGGAAQLAVLPWGNVNRVSVRFNTDVLVLDQDLAVRGVRASAYAVSGFDYDDATHTATWTLAQPVVNDKIILDLNGGPDGIVSPTAVALDGEWNSGSDSFPSGDGAIGTPDLLMVRRNLLRGLPVTEPAGALMPPAPPLVTRDLLGTDHLVL